MGWEGKGMKVLGGKLKFNDYYYNKDEIEKKNKISGRKNIRRKTICM
jgi:hypothetical protein